MHDHREKSDTSFEINNETFHLSLACYCLVGLLSFYTVKCIERQPRYFCTSNIVPRGFNSQKKMAPPSLWFALPYMITLKPSPPTLLLRESYKYYNSNKALYIVSCYPQSPQANLLPRLFTYPLAKSPRLPQQTNRHLLKCTLSKSLTIIRKI